jgi:threonine dehydrogenase-like Zn-dependent dehydrogenase
MKLLGNRIFLEMPKKEDSKLIVDENTKEALTKEMLKKLSKLKVHSVGDTVTTVKVGDMVLVDPNHLQKCPIIEVEKDQLILISPFDVILKW